MKTNGHTFMSMTISKSLQNGDSFHCAYAWQGAEYVNQTFGDELNFDIEEIDSIYQKIQ